MTPLSPSETAAHYEQEARLAREEIAAIGNACARLQDARDELLLAERGLAPKWAPASFYRANRISEAIEHISSAASELGFKLVPKE